MVQDSVKLKMADKYEFVHEMMSFSLTLNDPNPDFKGPPLVDFEYFRNCTR